MSEEHQYVASALTELGAVLTTDNRAPEAIDVLERALQIRFIDFDEDNELLAATRLEYGIALWQSGDESLGAQTISDSAATLSSASNRRAKRARFAMQLVSGELTN